VHRAGVHLYNKATRWGGEGIVVRRGADQTRIVGCYLDYTGIMLEESKQISITNSYFLGDAAIVLRATSSSTSSTTTTTTTTSASASVSSAMPVVGLTIAHNMFSGSGRGVAIVQLDGNFSRIIQTSVADNSATGMAIRTTRARASASAFAANWSFDLSQILLFPNAFAHVHYSFFVSPNDPSSSSTSLPNDIYIVGQNNRTDTGADTGAGLYRFPRHALRSVTHNRIVVASDAPVLATVSVDVDQSSYYDDLEALATSSPDLYT
jgi:hypothetical protein